MGRVGAAAEIGVLAAALGGGSCIDLPFFFFWGGARGAWGVAWVEGGIPALLVCDLVALLTGSCTSACGVLAWSVKGLSDNVNKLTGPPPAGAVKGSSMVILIKGDV